MKSKDVVKQISEATQKPQAPEISAEEQQRRLIASKRMYNALYKAKLVVK